MNNFLYYKVNSNQLSGTVDYLNVNENTQYKMIDSLPTPPQNGMLVYHQNDLKLYNNNQWESIANTNTNETFNNLTVVSSLNVSGNTSLKNTIVDNLTVNSSLNVSGNISIYGLPFPKINTITYKIENIGGTYFFTTYPSAQYGNIAIDYTLTTNIKYQRGEIYLDTTNCGFNNILYFNAYNVYTDKQNCNLGIRSDTNLYNTFIPPNPPPTIIKLFTYIDQTRVTTDLTTETLGGTVFIFNIIIMGN